MWWIGGLSPNAHELKSQKQPKVVLVRFWDTKNNQICLSTVSTHLWDCTRVMNINLLRIFYQLLLDDGGEDTDTCQIHSR